MGERKVWECITINKTITLTVVDIAVCWGWGLLAYLALGPQGSSSGTAKLGFVLNSITLLPTLKRLKFRLYWLNNNNVAVFRMTKVNISSGRIHGRDQPSPIGVKGGIYSHWKHWLDHHLPLIIKGKFNICNPRWKPLFVGS